MSEKIDVARFAREADEYANSRYMANYAWRQFRDEHFARLVMSECIRACNEGRESAFPISAETAIREVMP